VKEIELSGALSSKQIEGKIYKGLFLKKFKGMLIHSCCKRWNSTHIYLIPGCVITCGRKNAGRIRKSGDEYYEDFFVKIFSTKEKSLNELSETLISEFGLKKV
jgi:alpha-tubulin suppressor-like RCC1 family protein